MPTLYTYNKMEGKDNLHNADGKQKNADSQDDLLENSMVETSETSNKEAENVEVESTSKDTIVEGTNKPVNKRVDESTTHEDAIVEENQANDDREDTIVEVDDAVEAGLEKKELPAEEVATSSDNKEQPATEGAKKAEEKLKTSSEKEKKEQEDADYKKEAPSKDYGAMSMKQLIDELRHMMQEYPIQSFRKQADDIKKEFESKDAANRKEKEAEFKEANPPSDDPLAPQFEYKNELALQFGDLHALYRKQKGEFQREKRKQEEENLATRRMVIEGIKRLIDEEENIGTTFKKFSELQDQWKSTGNIPHDAYNITWEDYRLATQNFYDYIDVSRELRDKDFERNLEFKKKIIARAVELGDEEDIHKALRELQELHRMWKEDAGPVSKEQRDPIWDEFSAATKVIHDKRQAYYDERDKQLEKNQTIKENIITEIQKITYKGVKNHRQWQERLQEINVLKELFSKTGPAPKKVNNQLWDEYRKATREFNREKNDFYKHLKTEQNDNLAKKMKLVEIAEEHEKSENFAESIEVIKRIQAEWKTIGHVPRKDSDRIWKRFQKACNSFFDKKTEQRKEDNKEEMDNYKQKVDIYNELKELLPEEDKDALQNKVQAIMEKWTAVGRVPYSKKHIQDKFDKLVKAKFKSSGMNEVDAEMMKYQNKLSSLEQGNEKDMKNERFYLRKRREEIEGEVRQLENNLQFINAKDDKNPFLVQQRKNIDNLVKEMELIQEKQKQLNILGRQLKKQQEAADENE